MHDQREMMWRNAIDLRCRRLEWGVGGGSIGLAVGSVRCVGHFLVYPLLWRMIKAELGPIALIRCSRSSHFYHAVPFLLFCRLLPLRQLLALRFGLAPFALRPAVHSRPIPMIDPSPMSTSVPSVTSITERLHLPRLFPKFLPKRGGPRP